MVGDGCGFLLVSQARGNVRTVLLKKIFQFLTQRRCVFFRPVTVVDYRHQHRLGAADFGGGFGKGFAGLLQGAFQAAFRFHFTSLSVDNSQMAAAADALVHRFGFA